MQIHNVEQGSAEWFRLRAGVPTASEFKKIITSQGKPSAQLKDYAALLAAEKFAGDELERWEGNQWTDRGHELEPKARAAYKFTQNADIQEVGFCMNEKAGCSPDGLVGDGAVEIKCLSPQKHVLALAYYQKHQRPQPDYIPQAQGQIHIIGLEWCDLFFYHPSLPDLRIRVAPDSTFQAALAEQIDAVCAERDRLIQVLEAA